LLSFSFQRSILKISSLENSPEIISVTGFPEPGDGFFKCRGVQVTHLEADFLEAGDSEALAMLDDADELCGFKKRIMRAGIQPGRSAPEFLNLEAASLKVAPV
jgi:hypothetical protein